MALRFGTSCLVALVLLAGACNREDSAADRNAGANAAAPGNAAAPAAQVAVPAADLAGARALLDSIYTPYTRDRTTTFTAPFTPELTAAVARQSDDLTGLGYDPFCQCQDFGRFSYTIRSLEPAPDGAVARVSISNFGEPMVLTIRLARRGNDWLVADIGEGAHSMLRGGSGGR